MGLAPESVDEKQGADKEEGVGKANPGCKLAAEEGSGEHADELGRLVEAVDAAQAVCRRHLTDRTICRRDEAGHGDTVDEAQDAEAPDGRDESLWEGNDAGQ